MSSLPSLISDAFASSSSCFTDVALAIGAVTEGRAISQAGETWAGVAPFAAATGSTAFRMPKPRSLRYLPAPQPGVRPWRRPRSVPAGEHRGWRRAVSSQTKPSSPQLWRRSHHVTSIVSISIADVAPGSQYRSNMTSMTLCT